MSRHIPENTPLCTHFSKLCYNIHDLITVSVTVSTVLSPWEEKGRDNYHRFDDDLMLPSSFLLVAAGIEGHGTDEDVIIKAAAAVWNLCGSIHGRDAVTLEVARTHHHAVTLPATRASTE